MRPAVNAAAKTFPYSIIAAEIGVFTGDNALSMLQEIPQLKRLYLVDPYEVYEGYTDTSLFGSLRGDAEKRAYSRLMRYEDKIVWIKAKFGPNLIHEPLDLIYIDGNHDYEYVMWDLSNAWELCRDGGVIGGHDYYDDRYGVKRAVDEFCFEKNQRLSTAYIDWWFFKRSFVWSASQTKI